MAVRLNNLTAILQYKYKSRKVRAANSRAHLRYANLKRRTTR